MHESELENLYAALAGRETVREVAEALAPLGIRVMPLKGVLLHALGCADPLARPMVDVDLLVRRHELESACRCLGAQGWTVASRGPAAVMLVKPGFPLVIDLHHRLYAYERFGPSADAIRTRARLDREVFGVEVLLMDPLDLYAHLVGHFAKDRRDERQERTLVDLRRLADKAELSAERVAVHLAQAGLGRAARYTLGVAVSHLDDRFAADVLARLPKDPLGDLLAAWALRAVRAFPQPTKLAAVPVALLERSLTDGLISLATHAGLALAREVRTAVERRHATSGDGPRGG